MSVDFPRAWEIAKAQPFTKHHEECSYRVTQGGCLCDCPILNNHPDAIDDVLQGAGGKPFPQPDRSESEGKAL